MNSAEFDDVTLMAYADGVLESDEARRVAEVAQSNPAIAERVRMFRETGELLSALGRARAEEPLPEALAARVERALAETRDAETVVPFAAPRPPWRPMAMAAAGVALAAGAVGGIVATLALRAPDPSMQGITMFNAAGLGAALDTLPTGSRRDVSGGEVEMIASFFADDGVFCREFEMEGNDRDRIISVACREGADWVPLFAVRTAAEDGSSYAPASSLAALDVFLSTIGAGSPLSTEEEETRLREQE